MEGVLVAIALATAIKDLIELAQKLSDPLDKVARNMEKSRKLIEDIVKSLRQLDKVYEKYEDVLGSSVELKEEVDYLAAEMKNVQQKCLTLFNPPPTSKLKRAKVAFNAWLNAGKVEAEIASLKDHVNSCYMQFMTFATARIEGTTRRIQDTTARIQVSTTRIERLVLDQSKVAELQHIEGMVAKIDLNHEQQPPPVVTGDFLSGDLRSAALMSAVKDTYLRIHVDEIHQSLTDLASSQSYPVEEPIDGYLRPFESIITIRSITKPREESHREVVKKTLDILYILKQSSTNISIQEGAWDMVNLAIRLYHLHMYKEAATIGLWTVNLFRTLAKTDIHVYRPYLALSLHNLARYYIDIDSLQEALDATNECVEINRQLEEVESTQELKAQLGRALTTRALILRPQGGVKEALEDAQKAVSLFEGMLSEIDDWKRLMMEPTSGMTPQRQDTSWTTSTAFSSPISSTPSTYSDTTCVPPDLDNVEVTGAERIMYDYGRALLQLSYCLDDAEMDRVEAIDVTKKALVQFRHVCAVYPGTFFNADLAHTLYLLAHSGFRQFTPYDLARSYIEESVVLYTDLFQQDPKVYGIPLYDALWQQATILGGLERFDEAYEVWRQAVELAKKMMANQLHLADALYQACWSLRRLRRYDEAVLFRMESVQTYRSVLKTANMFEADGYHDLAVDLQLAERHQEAIKAAEDAITQYRALAFGNPEEHTKALAYGLTTLAHILVGASQPDRAVKENLNAMELYARLIESDANLVGRYVRCLRIQMSTTFKANNEDMAISRSRDVVRRFQELAVHHPAEVGWGIPDAMENHGLILAKFNRLQESIRWTEDVMEWFEQLPVDNPEAAERYLVCLINNCSDLDNQGFSEKALVSVEKAVVIGQQFCQENLAIASPTVSAMLRHAHILTELGRFAEALVSSTACVEFVRSITIADVSEVAGAFVVHAMTLLANQRHDEALTCAQEAVDIARKAPMETIGLKNMFCFLQLPQSLQILAECIAEAGDEDTALVVAQEAADEALRLRDKQSTLPWTFSESTYADTLLNLSIRLLATGDPSRSLELLEDVKATQLRRSQVRNGAYTEVACVLLTLGLCYCILGRHEEGIAARTELESVLHRLSLVFPHIHHNVVVALERERKRLSWARILSKLDLQCQHQHQHAS